METKVTELAAALNEAAEPVYRMGYNRGFTAGKEEAAHETVEHVGRRMVELAGWQLAIAIDIEKPELRWRAANLARNIYGRTPGGTGFAGGRLAGAFDAVCKSHNDIDEDKARELAELCTAVAKGEA